MQTDTSTYIDMNIDLNMTNTKENKKQCIKIYNLYLYLNKYEAEPWEEGKDANSQTDIRQVTFATLPLFCHKTIQYYSKTMFAVIQYNINTNICLHGHLHNYYKKVGHPGHCNISSFSNLRSNPKRGPLHIVNRHRIEAISCIKYVNICSKTNTK